MNHETSRSDDGVFNLMHAVRDEMVQALGIQRDSWGQYDWAPMDEDAALASFVGTMSLLLIRGLHDVAPTRMADPSYVFLDLVPGELRHLAGVPWMDWTPMPPTRVDMMLSQLGEPPRDTEAYRVWELRRDVIRDFAIDLIGLDLPGIDLASLLDDPGGAAGHVERNAGGWWVAGLNDHPAVRELLAEHLTSSD